MKKRPELLAPVGTFAMAKAAVHNGADAIYMGMPGFNARGRTEDMGLDEIREIVNYCHLYGLQAYIAFNILIFEEELERARRSVEELIPLGIDAFIVQDLGLARLIHSICPQQEIHASTQMSISNALAIDETADLNIARYVLARENSLEDLRAIRSQTQKELEVFVHGALCVAYSGQCLTSEHKGGRSANRGQCAQDCRMAYDLIVDGKNQPLGEKRYLVSPKDLCALPEIEKLCALNIESLKIEGRLKSPEYVASTVRSYRQAIDNRNKKNDNHENATAAMAPLYSRGFFSGWLHGSDHQQLVDASFGDHRGHFLGRVTRCHQGRIELQSDAELAKGDGILLANDKQEKIIGARIYSLSREANYYTIGFARDIDLKKVTPEWKAYLNNKPSLDKELQKSWNDRHYFKRIKISTTVHGKIGDRLSITLSDGTHTVAAQSETALEAATGSPARATDITAQFAKLEHTAYVLADSNIELDDNLFIPQKMLRQVKSHALKLLDTARIKPDIKEIKQSALPSLTQSSIEEKPKLSLLLREAHQLSALDSYTVDCIYLDFEHGRSYADALHLIKSKNIKAGIATTRILKPGEEKHLDEIVACNPDLILVRNLGALHYLQSKKCNAELIADFSFNCTNHVTANYLTSKQFARLTPSYDLNKKQLREMLANSGSIQWEVTIHQYMPEFHMQHCLFAAFLTDATDYPACKVICEKKRVDLRDKAGNHHPIKADMECRNTIFNATPQSAATLCEELRGLVSHFRIETLFESADEVSKKVEAYTALLSGKLNRHQLFESLQIVEKYGACEGQIDSERVHRDRKKSHR